MRYRRPDRREIIWVREDAAEADQVAPYADPVSTDLAQREALLAHIADLTAERDSLRRERDELKARERACPTMPEAEARALMRAVQAVAAHVGLGLDASPHQVVDAVGSMAARLAEIERQEPTMYIGACITDGTLHATVMSQDAAGNVTCVGQAEMDAASLVGRDCLARMSPPPTDEPERAEPADPRTPPPGCRLLGDHEQAKAGDMAYIGSIGGRWRPVRPRMGIIGATMDELSDSARVLALARPCRCGPDGCSDSVACQRAGGAA